MLTGDDPFDYLTTVVAEVSNTHFSFAHSVSVSRVRQVWELEAKCSGSA